MAPFWRIQCSAALVSSPPEKAMPTLWPAGRCSRILLMGQGSAEMADVVVGLVDADLEAGIAGDAEALSRAALLPVGAAGQLVFAAAGDAFHDFRRTGIEGQL